MTAKWDDCSKEDNGRLLFWIVMLIAAIALFLSAAITEAGTVSLQWDPVPGATGYRVYWGTASGVYDQTTTSDASTAVDVTVPADCTTYFFAVKAYDSSGVESVNFSNEISGWARPTISGANILLVEAGGAYTITIDGANIPTTPTVLFSNPDIVVTNTTRIGCDKVSVDFNLPPTAATGPVTVTIHDPQMVFGQAVDLFSVDAHIPPGDVQNLARGDSM